MAFQELSFESFNEKDMIKAWIYLPFGKPRGIVQLVHGFGEHSRRYLHMILKLNEAGYVVAADDHIGHGKTAFDSGNWSDWGDKGYKTMVEDEHTLRGIVQEQYPNVPYFMFGHSMGSMIARSYAANYGDEINGLILCGTPVPFHQADDTVLLLKKRMEEGKGIEVDPAILEGLLGWTLERIENPNTPYDWISGDPEVVADYASDPFNNFISPPNIRSLYSFVTLLETITGTQWAEQVPVEIPVYNIAGDQDAIGQYGEGVYAVSNWLLETGHKVETKIYSGYRHEIHNYRDIRDEVEDGIIDFLNVALNDKRHGIKG